MIKYCLQLANQRDHLLTQEHQLQEIKDNGKRFFLEKNCIVSDRQH
jgi:hypothetical protein